MIQNNFDYCLVSEILPGHNILYHTVKPEGRSLMGEWDIWNNMIAWCVDTYGPTPKDGVWTPGQRWYVNNSRFWFRDIKDKDWFILKWS